jgi:hypothetical protein
VLGFTTRSLRRGSCDKRRNNNNNNDDADDDNDNNNNLYHHVNTVVQLVGFFKKYIAHLHNLTPRPGFAADYVIHSIQRYKQKCKTKTVIFSVNVFVDMK